MIRMNRHVVRAPAPHLSAPKIGARLSRGSGENGTD